METPEIEIKIDEEALQALFQGKKVVYDRHQEYRVTLYPPRYGFFMTYEKLENIRNAAKMQGAIHLLNIIEDLRQEEKEVRSVNS